MIYKAEYPAGTMVRIAPVETLLQFARPQWMFHHPVEELLLSFSGKQAMVLKVGFYHGGDELYELDGIPGIWHEKCLENVTESP